MTTVDPARFVAEGLTPAAEALAIGNDDLQVREALEHMLPFIGDVAATVVTPGPDSGSIAERKKLRVLADTADFRTQSAYDSLVGTAIARAIGGGTLVLLPEPRDAAIEREPGTWVVLPMIAGRKTWGALIVTLAERVTKLPSDLDMTMRAAAALVVSALPRTELGEPVRQRTRKITLNDVDQERRLRAVERYRAFIDSASDGIVALDPDGNVLYMNQAAEQVTGYARAGLAGHPLAQIVPESHRKLLAEQLALATAGQAVASFDLDLVTTSKDRLTMSVASIGVLSEHGIAIFAFRDVTLARGLEIDLRRTSEFLERILNSAVDGIIAADLRGTVVLFNHGAERICGYKAADVIGKMSVSELYPGGVAQEVMRLLRSTGHGGGGRLEPVRRDLKSASGELIPVSISAALVLDDAGREIATVGIFSDLRDRLRMEERLASAQEKLALSEKQVVAMELAGAAAHELNQPLTSVMGYAQMLIRKLEPGSPHLKACETILAEAERMAGIVRKLGSLTRYETKSYVGGAQILDIERSARRGETPSPILIGQPPPPREGSSRKRDDDE